jgi:hypothetical protein
MEKMLVIFRKETTTFRARAGGQRERSTMRNLSLRFCKPISPYLPCTLRFISFCRTGRMCKARLVVGVSAAKGGKPGMKAVRQDWQLSGDRELYQRHTE